MSSNNCYKFMAIFIAFPGFCLNILQKSLRGPCNQEKIAAVIFRWFPRNRLAAVPKESSGDVSQADYKDDAQGLR